LPGPECGIYVSVYNTLDGEYAPVEPSDFHEGASSFVTVKLFNASEDIHSWSNRLGLPEGHTQSPLQVGDIVCNLEWSDRSKITQTQSRTCSNMCTQAGRMGCPHERLIHSTRNSNFRQAIAVEGGQAKVDQINILHKMIDIESKHKVVGFDVSVDYSMSVQIFKSV
jgi:hypothetical protein